VFPVGRVRLVEMVGLRKYQSPTWSPAFGVSLGEWGSGVRGRTELFGEYDAAPVEGEEVEVECVDDALAFVYDDYETRGFGARTAVAAGRFRAFEPLGVGCDVVVAGEVDILATIFTKIVQLVEIVEGERSI
jgi:hypothetical protein